MAVDYHDFNKICISYVAKVIEGAGKADYEKVCAYAEKLSQELEAAGELESAKRIRQGYQNSKAQKLALARSGALLSGVPAFHVPVDSESRLAMANEERLSIHEAEAFLAENVSCEIERFIKYLKASDKLFSEGVGVSATMLLYGPPGCGKTQIAKNIAARLELPLITARSDGIISSYLGSTAKNIRLLFEHAMARPCVLFLDEFDAIAKMRDDSRELGELKRVVISLLQNIDAMGKDHVLIAATNHEHLLDPAIWRRFNFPIRITSPDRECRFKIISRGLGRFKDDEMVCCLSAITEGVSGGILNNLAEDVRRQAIVDDQKSLDWAETIKIFLNVSLEKRKYASEDLIASNEAIKMLRDIDPKLFTQSKMSQIFRMSQSQISKILKSGNEL
jgi:SpoVK/Ycf46/Vps4 family AAA+-type ATPase